MITAGPNALAPARKSFRATQFELREAAILDAAGRLLARVGFEAMSMDDIAAEVGVAKGSLYRHFSSKERLGAAVLRRLVCLARDRLDALTVEVPSPLGRLRALVGWSLRQRLAGAVPLLPSTSPALRHAVQHDAAYAAAMGELSAGLAACIAQAKAAGELRPDLQDDFVLCTVHARCCDPTLDLLRARCALSDADLVDQLVSSCFDGLVAAPGRERPG